MERASTNWWDPAPKPGGKLTWEQVRALISDEACDPLKMERQPRSGQIVRELAVATIIAAAIICLTMAAATLLTNSVSQPSLSDSLTVPTGITVFVAFMTAALTIIFTFYQLKAKVRADNRQTWIAKVRTLIAEVISLSDERIGLGESDSERSDENWRQLSPRRLELELLLNPSEKDHRLLMHFTQMLAIRDIAHIQDAVSLRASVAQELGCDEARMPASWIDILENDNKAKLIGRAMRLSHVVLKREWERVKTAR